MNTVGIDRTDYPTCQILDDTELEQLNKPPAQPQTIDWSHEPTLSKRYEPSQTIHKPTPLTYKQTLLTPVAARPPVSSAAHELPLHWLTPQFIAMYGVPLIPFPSFEPITLCSHTSDVDEDRPYAPMTLPITGAMETISQYSE